MADWTRHEIFYEIEYDSDPAPRAGKSLRNVRPQKIKEPERDEVRELFGQMRDIARTYWNNYDFSKLLGSKGQSGDAIIFCKQGLFMKDFTDDYKGNAQFLKFPQYTPSYQMMGYEQLRVYFTWRTQVRQGTVTDMPMPYALLYINELLCNIGVANPQDGLDKLIFFWKAFSKHDPLIDKYVLRWLKDYHVYYELPHSFYEFVNKNDLIAYYPKLVESENSFDLFCKISKYNIKKSTFFTDETSKMISDCFAFVMARIKQDFEASGMRFDNTFFRPTKKIVQWKPFEGALFSPQPKQPDRKIVLSENEIYMCKRNKWSFSTNITTEKGKRFIGYVMKEMESILRKVTKYKYKLTADMDMIHEDTIRVLTKAGVYIEKIVTAAVMEYHKEVTKTVVTVNRTALDRIRHEALATQNALMVEEQMRQAEEQMQPVKEQMQQIEEQAQQKGINEIEESPARLTTPDHKVFADAFEEAPATVSGIWKNLKDVLNEDEVQTLAVVLQGGDIKAFADTCGVMIEVLVDGINEKAMDHIGDNLMDEEFVLYDDYKEQVKELVK